jgi:3-oxosteroid 1-dehydrogenase
MENGHDVVVVGSGGGGLVAGLMAKANGLDPLVIEKTEYLGGTTALSHGALWLPNNPLGRAAGFDDSVEAGLDYLQSVVGDQGPATTRVRQEALIRGGDRAVRFLQSRGVELRLISNYPDYYPDAPGARLEGRMIAAPMLDARVLGDWQSLPRPRPPLPGGIVMSSVEQFLAILSVGFSWKSRAAVAKVAATSAALKARGVKPLVMGQAYIGQLLRAARASNLRIARNTALKELRVDDGRVTGVVAVAGGRETMIRARHGVLLTAGDYSRNPALRAEFGPQPASTNWTATIAADTGDAFTAATSIGAATAHLDKAYWLPGLINQHGNAMIFVAERVVPHSILVDSAGQRFANEAQSYMQLGNEQYARQQTVPAIPAYLIIDARHRRRYTLGETLPGVPPRAWLASGHLKRAATLRELADQCGIDADGLESTVTRFNQMAREGVDRDFGRGSNAYDLVYADPGHGGPNPSLGTIEEAPFYAAKMVPTDVGMAGGLLTDEYARVINRDGDPIEGLYASGTSAASCMGDKYPGGGTSLVQSTVFGFIAAEHIVERATSMVGVG